MNEALNSSFQNCAPIDFSLAGERQRFADALGSVEAAIASGHYSANPVLGGEEISCEESIPSIDPSDGKTVVGNVGLASKELASSAADLARTASATWSRVPASQRAECLRKAAALMTERRYELAALIVREAGKPWKEADADLAEAVDFCDFYASEMMRLAEPKLTQQVMGERNITFYRGRGVALVISPWNFPLAIPCGMVCASLVTGNSVIFKPAEQTSIIAAELVKILYKAGVPKDVLSFLPGRGEEIGPMLVEHPAVNLTAFTGSRPVGLDIIKRSAVVQEGQHFIKRVIAELGGKNAIIVDEDADFDEALKGVLYSAFGYAGQKCSATSRLIVVGPAYEPFLERLAAAAKDYPIGSASESSTLIGPVVDGEAQSRIETLCERLSESHNLLFKGDKPQEGYFVAPHIFRDVPKDSELWREEAFAPVLACAKANSFEEALEMANESQYALTGGVFSRSPRHIEMAYKDFLVGNLYINRSTTGAIVQRQPFGGFRLSGIGSKAGGSDYLIQFMEPRTISENTMRRGFSPDLVT